VMHGFRRKPFQVLPESGVRINCVQINDENQANRDWWWKSVAAWRDRIPDALRGVSFSMWDYVLVVPHLSVRSFWCGNDGMQAWRYRGTGLSGEYAGTWAGYVVPDFCRQEGGCPEMWNGEADVKGKAELVIKNLKEIEPMVVIDHQQQVTRLSFPEVSAQRVRPTS